MGSQNGFSGIPWIGLRLGILHSSQGNPEFPRFSGSSVERASKKMKTSCSLLMSLEHGIREFPNIALKMTLAQQSLLCAMPRPLLAPSYSTVSGTLDCSSQVGDLHFSVVTISHCECVSVSLIHTQTYSEAPIVCRTKGRTLVCSQIQPVLARAQVPPTQILPEICK